MKHAKENKTRITDHELQEKMYSIMEDYIGVQAEEQKTLSCMYVQPQMLNKAEDWVRYDSSYDQALHREMVQRYMATNLPPLVETAPYVFERIPWPPDSKYGPKPDATAPTKAVSEDRLNTLEVTGPLSCPKVIEAANNDIPCLATSEKDTAIRLLSFR